jgi:hypothetical protein
MAFELDPATNLAVSVIRRAVAGDCVELVQKDLIRYDPTAHRCHDNVREWVKLYPKYKHVYGFLVSNQRAIDTSVVIAHSAVEDTDGTLCDITPSESEYRYPFVRHVGTEAEFELIAAREPFMLEVSNSLLRELGVLSRPGSDKPLLTK